MPGVGVPGVLLALLSPNKLLLSGFALPSKLNRFVAEPPPRAFWNSGLPVFGEKGELDVDFAIRLPDRGEWLARSLVLKLLRGVDFW